MGSGPGGIPPKPGRLPSTRVASRGRAESVARLEMHRGRGFGSRLGIEIRLLFEAITEEIGEDNGRKRLPRRVEVLRHFVIAPPLDGDAVLGTLKLCL